MTSPFDNPGVSAEIVSSTGLPAGTMIHTTRGAVSFDTTSAGAVAPSAPRLDVFLNGRGRSIEYNHAVAASHQPLRHVAAHPAEADHCELHRLSVLSVEFEPRRRESAPKLFRRLKQNHLEAIRSRAGNILLAIVDKHGSRSLSGRDLDAPLVKIRRWLAHSNPARCKERVEDFSETKSLNPVPAQLFRFVACNVHRTDFVALSSRATARLSGMGLLC